MLQRINGHPIRACIRMAEAEFPAPFAHTLEYSPAARGTWNIVHTGMLLPETHQIYICAAGCLRGVVLTAAEMGAMERFSTIEVKEAELTDADNENFLITGISDIIDRLPQQPRAVLVFPACVHHFLGVNFAYVYASLCQKYPHIDFIPCMMDPIRQTRSLTPEQRERRAIYQQLRPAAERDAKACNILSSNLPTDPDSELMQLLTANGWKVRDMTTCTTYDEFLQMARAQFNLWYNPFGGPAAQDCATRLGQDSLQIPQLWRYEEISAVLQSVAARIGVPQPDWQQQITACEQALATLYRDIGKVPIVLDFTFAFNPASLARLLLEHGFNVCALYADAFLPEDEPNFRWLQQHYPDLWLWSTKNADMRLQPRTTDGKKVLALGQKAAYFTGTPYFVNLVEGGGLFAFTGIVKLAHLMQEAFHAAKDTEALIRRKGWGGPCCLC